MNELEEKIIKIVDSMRKEIIEFHQQMIRLPSENPPGKYKEISEFVEKKMNDIGLKTINKRKNIIGTIGDSESPSLILYGHMDTVPRYDGWTQEPFGAEIIDGKMYGRGACDDKACVTAEIFATKALLDSGIELKGSLEVLSVVDEESGGFGGVKLLLDKGLVRGDVCLLGDGRGNYPAAFTAGFLMVVFVITGKKAHALGFPDIPKYRNEQSGVNAIKKMIKVMNFLMELQEEFLKTESKYPNFPGHPSKVSTINIGLIKGGGELSAVPDKCVMQCVINTIPEQDVESVKNRINTFIENYKREDPNLNIKVQTNLSFKPYIADLNTAFAKSVEKAVKTVYGEEREFKMFLSASDAHWFQEKEIETIMMGCGTHKNKVHAEDEYIHIEELIATTKIFALTALNYLKS